LQSIVLKFPRLCEHLLQVRDGGPADVHLRVNRIFDGQRGDNEAKRIHEIFPRSTGDKL
jgi:hypothetical protein